MRAAFLFLYLAVANHLCAQQSDVPYVLLVSFDGFRHDYVSKFDAAHFKSIMIEGSYAKALIPSFPSKTFPNHYTLVTGLYPGHHGLVDNAFYDPDRKVYYGMSAKNLVTDPYFYGGKPIWQLAKENGIMSASYFWVGTELPDNHPDYFYPFNDSVPDTTRISEVFRWLALPEDKRPHFISLYFSSPDHEGHQYGPDADETRNAVLHADALLGRIVRGIDKSKLPVNLIVVSDHGMRGLKQDQSSYIFLDELFNVADTTIKISNGGTQAHFYLRKKQNVDSLITLLRLKAQNYTVVKRDSFPPRWHYDNSRAGDFLMVADDGYYIRSGSRDNYLKSLKSQGWFGVHGYDPERSRDVWGYFLRKVRISKKE